MAAGKPILYEFQIFQLLHVEGRWAQRPILDAIRERRFDLIVQSSSSFPNFPSIEADYVERGPAVSDRRALWPLAGTPRRPETYYVPKPAAASDARTPR